MFALNENVVYPGYGVARVSRIFERTIGTQVACFYELRFLHKDMTILVPVDNLTAVGVRSLNSLACVAQVRQIMATPAQPQVRADMCAASSWNKRNKRYQAQLRGGNLVEIAKIYRDLQCLAHEKDLSFGERALLVQTEALLAEEIALIEQGAVEQVMLELRGFFGTTCAVSRKESVQRI